MGYLKLDKLNTLELFLTDKGKELMLRENALGITTGCIEILVLVYVGLCIYNRFIRVDDKMDKETFINVAIDTTNLPVVDDDGKQVRPTALFPKNYDKNK